MTQKLEKLLQHPLDLQQKEPEQHHSTGIWLNIILCDFYTKILSPSVPLKEIKKEVLDRKRKAPLAR